MLTCKRALFLAAFLSTLCLLLTRLSTRAREETTLREHLSLVFPYDSTGELPKYIWQAWIHPPSQDESQFRRGESSWATLNPDFEHEIVRGDAAGSIIARMYSNVPAIPQAFEALPKAVLKADFFRYLILLARGGIYTDIDTTALKPVADWIPTNMQPFGLAVRNEADPDRPDWHDWYARRIQFCQWTIASRPGHPVLLDIVASITEETLNRRALGVLDQEAMQNVMDFTGPGIWTDSLFNFFNRPGYLDGDIPKPRNVTWQQFANLTQPKKESDVVVLPITSFSPGVGHMGSRSLSDPQAFVHHWFSGKDKGLAFDRAYADAELGTWKHDEQDHKTKDVSI